MIERFASCAKSTISIDDDSCQREACVELRRKLLNAGTNEGAQTNRQDLTSEIERQKRKILILQKSKQLLVEEVALIKEQLQSKNLKLKKLQPSKGNDTCRSNEPLSNEVSPNYSLIIQEKQQQIDLLRSQLKENQKQLIDLQYENNEMKEEIISKQAILDKLRESSKAQISFYKKHIIELEQQVNRKKQEITCINKLHDDLMRKQNMKWENAVGNYNNKMTALDKEIHQYKSKIQQMTKNIHFLEQKKAETDQSLVMEKEKNAWLTRLLEEAKIQFMHTELKRLEKKEKTIKRKTSHLSKQNLFNEKRSYRSTSQASTALTSAKTVGEQPRSTPVAPFRLHAQSSQLYRLSHQDSENFEVDWPNIIELNPFNQN